MPTPPTTRTQTDTRTDTSPTAMSLTTGAHIMRPAPMPPSPARPPRPPRRQRPRRPHALAPRRTCPSSTACRCTAFPRSPAMATASSSATATPVRPFSPCSPRIVAHLRHSPSSLPPRLYAHQGRRRWLLWHCLARRLARVASPEYTGIRHAAQRERPAGIREQAAGGRQEDEEAVVRLGRVPTTERASGRPVSPPPARWRLTRSTVSADNTLSSQRNPSLRLFPTS
jgi:hypothetical protein